MVPRPGPALSRIPSVLPVAPWGGSIGAVFSGEKSGCKWQKRDLGCSHQLQREQMGDPGLHPVVCMVRLTHVVVSHCFKLISLPTFQAQVALHRNRDSWLLLQQGSSGSMESTLRT